MTMKEALYYNKLDDSNVQCLLCPHTCTISQGNMGICGVRRSRKGTLCSEIYGRLAAIAMDPIEKKPLYHFYPATEILSIGTKGCNLKCPYCQNWHISQKSSTPLREYPSETVIKAALENKSIGVAYTYSEPIVWYEFVKDTAELAHKNNLKNVMVTNGFINQEPLEELTPYIDAMNIDLKSYNKETYQKIQKGKLKDVLNTIKYASEVGCHVEITTLLVTKMNDNLDEMKGLIDFIASVDPKIPWHISRYYPNYNYDEPATDIDFILKVYDEARKTLDFVYTGNIPSSYGGSDTKCPSCNTILINRSGHRAFVGAISEGACSSCGEEINVVL